LKNMRDRTAGRIVPVALAISMSLPFLALAQSPPPNDDFGNRITLTGSSISANGSNVNATKQAGEGTHADNTGGKSVWWSWTAPTNGNVTLSTAGSSFDTLLAVYTGESVSALVLVESNDDDAVSGELTSLLNFDAVTGITYQIAVDGFNDDFGTIDSGAVVLDLRLGPPILRPANDRFADRILMPGSTNTVTGTNLGASKEAGEPDHAGNPGGKSVWWSWTAPMAGTITLSTAGSSFDTVLGIYTGSSLATLAEVASDDDGGTNRSSRATFFAAAGTAYQIAVDGFRGASGQITLSMVSGGLPAPDWEVKDLDGNTVKSADFAGRVVLLNFWATWCGPCIAEIPDLIELQNQYSLDGLTVVGPSTDTVGVAVVQQFVLDHGMNYPVVMANTQMQRDYGGISAIPATFVIDREGKIVARFVGSRNKAVFESVVVPLLKDVRPKIQRTDGGLMISWPSAQSGFVLESAEGLSGPAWIEVSGPFDVVNGFLNFAIAPADSQRFYRLKK